jgi:hypothetical protein
MRKKAVLATAIAAACALAVVATALAASGNTHRSTATRHAAAGTTGEAGAQGPHGPGGPGWHAVVHSESVVPNRKGDAFITVTSDGGTIKSVDAGASTITIAEGVKSLTYKTVTLTIPSGATVLLDGKSSSVGSLAAEDHVIVSSSSEGTTVFATDSSFQPLGMGHGGLPPGAGPPAGA